MSNRVLLGVVLIVQAACAMFFVSDILISVLGLPVAPLNWAFVELIQVGAAIGLVTGVIVSALALRQARARTRQAEAALRRAWRAIRRSEA